MHLKVCSGVSMIYHLPENCMEMTEMKEMKEI